jgi:O-antigen/teichoic acid export membrane protein
MIAEARIAVRNVGLLLLLRGADAVGGLVFAVLIPRLMGPQTYGQYALVTSLSIWFVLFSELGFTPAVGRYVPKFTHQEDSRGLQALLGNMLVLRLISGAVAAGLYLLLTALWLRDVDLLVLGIVGATVLVRTVATLLFAFFLGLNQAARWETGEILRRWGTLLLLLPGFVLGGLRGAALALLLTEFIVLVVGIRWAGPHLSWAGLRLDGRRLSPFLRFALIFFGGDLLLSAFRRSGEALVRAITLDYAQVGYFGLAYNVYLTAGLAIPRLALAFAPLLVTLLAEGQIQSLRAWVERLVKWLAIGAVLVLFGVLLVGSDVVPLALGDDYGAVTANLIPLALSLSAQALADVARLLALVTDRPGEALVAAGVRLAVFWALAPLLIANLHSLGGCLAVLVASVLHAGYFTWRMQRVIRYSLRGWALAIGLAAVFLPLVGLRSSWPVNVGLYGLFVGGYGGLLVLLRVATPGEFAAAWQALRSSRPSTRAG